MKYHSWARVGNELVMSAWGDIDLPDGALYAYEWGDSIYIVTDNATYGKSILKYQHRSLPETDIGYEPHLDRRETPTGSPYVIYHESMNWTEFVHTGRPASSNSRLVTGPDSGSENGGRFVSPIHMGEHDDLGGSANSAFFYGRLDNNGTHWLGFKIGATITLTDLWPGTSSVELRTARFHIFHKNTTDYVVQVALDRRDITYTSKWQSTTIGQTIIGASSVHTGFSTHMLTDDLRQATVTIESDTPGDMIIEALEYKTKAIGR